MAHTLTSHATYMQQGWKGSEKGGERGGPGVGGEGLGRGGKGEMEDWERG